MHHDAASPQRQSIFSGIRHIAFHKVLARQLLPTGCTSCITFPFIYLGGLMSVSKLSLLAVAGTLTLSGVAALADTLNVGGSSGGGVMTVTIDNVTRTGSGGNFIGSSLIISP